MTAALTLRVGRMTDAQLEAIVTRCETGDALGDLTDDQLAEWSAAERELELRDLDRNETDERVREGLGLRPNYPGDGIGDGR